MSDTTIVVTREKSNAPLICGIIGFVLEIPNLACNLLCAAASTVAVGTSAGLVSSNGNEFDNAAANKAAEATAGSMSTVMWVGFLLSLLCFIFCFFGKKKCAMALGIITILAALYIMISACIFFSIFGLAAGILFLVQGIMMIINAKRC